MTGNGPRELHFLETASETAGELLAMEATYPPRTSYPPEHRHPAQEERFTVLVGALTVRLDGVVRCYAAGESVVIPRGVCHTMHNAEPGETRVRWEVRPALQTAEFFSALAAGDPNSGKVATLIHQATVLQFFRREMILTKPPVPIQRALFAVLALFAGRGRRATREATLIERAAE